MIQMLADYGSVCSYLSADYPECKYYDYFEYIEERPPEENNQGAD